MLQIKTIKDPDPDCFDARVNDYLADGWTLARRLTGPDVLIAELEKDIITEAEKCCENCRHFENDPHVGACAGCNGDKWEEAE